MNSPDDPIHGLKRAQLEVCRNPHLASLHNYLSIVAVPQSRTPRHLEALANELMQAASAGWFATAGKFRLAIQLTGVDRNDLLKSYERGQLLTKLLDA